MENRQTELELINKHLLGESSHSLTSASSIIEMKKGLRKCSLARSVNFAV